MLPSEAKKGVIDLQGAWYKQPSVRDYNKTMLADEGRKLDMDENDIFLQELPRRNEQ